MGSKVLDSGITPLHIEIALHYFKSRNSDAIAYTGRDSEAAAQICHEFADAGLLEIADDNKHWKATDRMRQYVESICRVSLPENVCMRPDMISHLDAILNGRNSRVGEETIKTRNARIMDVMDEYVKDSPLARF